MYCIHYPRPNQSFPKIRKKISKNQLEISTSYDKLLVYKGVVQKDVMIKKKTDVNNESMVINDKPIPHMSYMFKTLTELLHNQLLPNL